MIHLGDFFETYSFGINSVTRQVNFDRTKIGGKCQIRKIQMRHFESFSNSARVLVKVSCWMEGFWREISKETFKAIFKKWNYRVFMVLPKMLYYYCKLQIFWCWSREGGASAPFLLLCSSPASLELLSSWRSRSLSIIKQWMLQWGSWRTRQRKDSNCEKMPQKL